jgi:hypothetical protein
MTNTDWTVATDLNAKMFDRKAISIFDMYRETLRSGARVIEGRTFNNCRLEGPAVIAILGGLKFDRTDFGYTGGDVARLVLRSASSTGVVGVIPFKDCSFTGCNFFAVGYTGPEDFLQQILALQVRPV